VRAAAIAALSTTRTNSSERSSRFIGYSEKMRQTPRQMGDKKFIAPERP
jgi:hypothetical protein